VKINTRNETQTHRQIHSVIFGHISNVLWSPISTLIPSTPHFSITTFGLSLSMYSTHLLPFRPSSSFPLMSGKILEELSKLRFSSGCRSRRSPAANVLLCMKPPPKYDFTDAWQTLQLIENATIFWYVRVKLGAWTLGPVNPPVTYNVFSGTLNPTHCTVLSDNKARNRFTCMIWYDMMDYINVRPKADV